jgi:hypothetical protein
LWSGHRPVLDARVFCEALGLDDPAKLQHCPLKDILDAPEGRRDDFVDSYFKRFKTAEVVVILKTREPVRTMIAIGSEVRWQLQLAQRWIVQYNFYINDQG